ncbi:hypothetical protein [Streptomyces sp. NPDC087294]|uniref:hypothetical protein n=1 Tax=Streptomyces sp. NPDC087294 TaxID=3365777 RepID=UPI003830AB42
MRLTHTRVRALLVAVCAAGVALTTVPAAQAAPQANCRYYYTSAWHGPNGETTGSGNYAEGDTDPEGRVCENGWWVTNGESDGQW